MKTKRIAFLGGGNMAEAILGGLLAGDVALAGNLVAADVSAARRAWLEKEYGIDATTADNATAVRGADVVVLAVKPQQAAEVLAAREGLFGEATAGVDLRGAADGRAGGADAGAGGAGDAEPAGAGARGVSAICGGARATAADLDAGGGAVRGGGRGGAAAGGKMNEVTALSGSGPGLCVRVHRGDGGAAVAMGIEPATARKMAIETVRGAAELAAKTARIRRSCGGASARRAGRRWRGWRRWRPADFRPRWRRA
jgi:pyrroline-5-carboxylate reductase